MNGLQPAIGVTRQVAQYVVMSRLCQSEYGPFLFTERADDSTALILSRMNRPLHSGKEGGLVAMMRRPPRTFPWAHRRQGISRAVPPRRVCNRISHNATVSSISTPSVFRIISKGTTPGY
jgi:hypothetical protein